jgi:transcriptional regulator with XRE-family HTH domain
MAKGLTQRDLSDATEIHIQHIAQCENGNITLSEQELAYIARSLDIDNNELIDGIEIDAVGV